MQRLDTPGAISAADISSAPSADGAIFYSYQQKTSGLPVQAVYRRAPDGSVTTSALAAGQWLPLALTTFVTTRWIASAFSVAYLSIAKVGTPGTIEIAPALYVL